MRDWLNIAILGIVLLMVTLMGANTYVDCKSDGGKLVRGAFWYECLEKE